MYSSQWPLSKHVSTIFVGAKHQSFEAWSDLEQLI